MLLQKGVQLARSLIILYIMLLLGNLISYYIPSGNSRQHLGLVITFFRFNDSCNSLGVDLFRFELTDPIHGGPFCTGERGDYQIL